MKRESGPNGRRRCNILEISLEMEERGLEVGLVVEEEVAAAWETSSARVCHKNISLDDFQVVLLFCLLERLFGVFIMCF